MLRAVIEEGTGKKVSNIPIKYSWERQVPVKKIEMHGL